MARKTEMRSGGNKDICVIFPYELAWAKDRPVPQIPRLEWLLEGFRGKVTLIEPYLRKEFCSGPTSYARELDLPENYEIVAANRYLTTIRAQFACIPSVLGLLGKIKPSVIWSIKPVPVSTLPALIYRSFNPCLWLADCDDWEGKGGVASFSPPIYRHYDLFEKFVYDRADGVTVSSLALLERIKGLSPSAKAACLPNGPTRKMLDHLAPSPPELKNGAPVVLYIGNILRHSLSDIFILADIAEKLKGLDVSWVVVGSGNCLDEAMAYVKKKGVEDKFLFTGSKSWPEAADYLKAADIVVYFRKDNPVQRAGSPIKLLEYMAAGKAIVTTGIGQSEQLIRNGVTGILVPPDDLAAASKAISYLLEDGSFRERLGQASRSAAEAINSNNASLSFVEEMTKKEVCLK
jgi:glycosyltransferase involved in cell wall biosynthesis